MGNMQFMYVTKDGEEHPVNISGVCNVIDAAFEIASSIMHGDLDVNPDDIVEIRDIAG